jgi:hypothetical protein
MIVLREYNRACDADQGQLWRDPYFQLWHKASFNESLKTCSSGQYAIDAGRNSAMPSDKAVARAWKPDVIVAAGERDRS